MVDDSIQTWPDSLNRSVSSSFTLGSLNGMAQPLFQTAQSVFAEPFDRRWFATVQSPPLGETETIQNGETKPSWREVEGRIAALKGISRKVRLFDPDNIQPAYNLSRAGALSNWSDGRTWSGGAQWISGFLPPFLTVDEVAEEEAESIVVRGLPENTAKVLRWGDRLECRPNGVPLTHGAYHMVTEVSNANAAGKTRLYFGPGLRVGLNAGDQIVLKYPTSVFTLLDDKQGVVTRNTARIGSFGWSLIEALRFE